MDHGLMEASLGGRGGWGWAVASPASPSLALLSLRGPHSHLSAWLACRPRGEGGVGVGTMRGLATTSHGQGERVM